MKRRCFLQASLATLAAPALARDKAPFPAVDDYERATGGRVGFSIERVKTGRKLAWRDRERFLMCSSFKASLAAFALSQVDEGMIRLDDHYAYGQEDLMAYAPAARANLEKGSMSVAEMCEAAVELSDNTCANVLLAHLGGPAKLTAYWRSIGDQVSRLEHNEPELNYAQPGEPDTTTPAATAGNLRQLILGKALSADSNERLTGWMIGCKTGDKRLRAGLPKDWLVADKTGNNGIDAFIDIAVFWPQADDPLIVCAYTQGGSPTPDQVDALFAGIGHFVGQNMI